MRSSENTRRQEKCSGRVRCHVQLEHIQQKSERQRDESKFHVNHINEHHGRVVNPRKDGCLDIREKANFVVDTAEDRVKDVNKMKEKESIYDIAFMDI